MKRKLVALVFIVGWLTLGCRKGAPNPDMSNAPGTPTEPSGIVLQAFWEPWQGQRLDQLFQIPVYGDQFRHLKVAQPERQYQDADFSVFLPEKEVAVGESWAVPAQAAEKFLSQFHADVKANYNIDGAGCYAILRAKNQTHWDISIRLHSSFYFPEQIYLTPAQFDGHLVLDLTRKKVEEFSLKVPTTHLRNLAFEQHAGDFWAGVGHVPRMELVMKGKTPSQPRVWTEELTETRAREVLATKFLACEEVDWLPLEEALERASETGKPVFAIVIEGALTDQTC